MDKKDPENQLLDFLYTRKNQSGIIYCFSRRQVDELSELLIEQGYAAKPYHAGLMSRERTINQQEFIRDDIRIIVATIAFGNGDKQTKRALCSTLRYAPKHRIVLPANW